MVFSALEHQSLRCAGLVCRTVIEGLRARRAQGREDMVLPTRVGRTKSQLNVRVCTIGRMILGMVQNESAERRQREFVPVVRETDATCG